MSLAGSLAGLLFAGERGIFARWEVQDWSKLSVSFEGTETCCDMLMHVNVDFANWLRCQRLH